MTNGTIIAHLYPNAVGLADYALDAQGSIVAWNVPKLGPQPTPAEIAAAELPATKAASIAANRAECSRRIVERYPTGRQLSALAGLYGSAPVATMVDWIAANIAAENTAADAIEAVQPGPNAVAEVEAVSVSWPV